MAISREKIDTKDEQDILSGMIISDNYCKNVRQLIRSPYLFQVPQYRKIVKWITDFYDTYEKAPGEHLREMFYFHRDSVKDDEINILEDTISLLETNSNSIKSNFSYELYFDKAFQYLSKQSLMELAARIKGYAEKGEITRAEHIISEYTQIKKDIGQGLDPINDPDIEEKLFEESQSEMFSIPGAIGKAIIGTGRGELMGVAGAAKAGKSYLLMEFAKYALVEGLKVAFFSLEMTDIQCARRFFANYVKGSFRATKEEKIVPKIVDGEITYDWEIPHTIERTDIRRERNRIKLGIGAGGIRFFDTTTSGCTLTDIYCKLDNLKYFEEWDADVVVIDYADIIESESKHLARFEQEDEKWKLMKREIAQKRNCFCISASQLNREALDADKTGIKHTAGSVRKFDHVSVWLSISMNELEKKAGLARCTVQGRHGDFDTVDQILLTRCLSIGRPIIDSCRMSEVSNLDEYKEMILHNKMDMDD